jgi:hypothetical protein
MRTNKTKEEFINDLQTRIETRKDVLNIYENLFLPLLKKFDGKVFNKRFKTQFAELLKANNIENVLLRDMNLSFTNCRYTLDKQNYKFNYSDVESLYFQFVLSDGRIDFEATISNEENTRNLNQFKNSITSYERCINNYDKYMEIAKETEEKINEFNNMHYLFRQNVKINSLYN